MTDNLSKTSAALGEGGSRPGSSQGQPIVKIKWNRIAGGVAAKAPKRPASSASGRTTSAKLPSAEAGKAAISPAVLNRKPTAAGKVAQGAVPASSPAAFAAAKAATPEPAAAKSQAATHPGSDAGVNMEAVAPARSALPAAKPDLLAAAAAAAARLAEAAAAEPKPFFTKLQPPTSAAVVPAPVAGPAPASNGTAAEHSRKSEPPTSKEKERKERREKDKEGRRSGERKRRRSDSPSRTGGSAWDKEEEGEMGGGERSQRRQRRSYSSSGDDDHWKGGGYDEGDAGGGGSGDEGTLRDEEKERERRRKDLKDKGKGGRGDMERRRRDRSSEERDRERRREESGRGDRERHPRDRLTRYEYADDRGRYYGADDDRYDRERGERGHRNSGRDRSRDRSREREQRHGEARRGERERQHDDRYREGREREREHSRKRHRSKSPTKEKEKERKKEGKGREKDGDRGKRRDKDKDADAAVAKKEESLPPPPPPAPPSPDITQHLTAIAKAHKMEFSPETGMSDAKALFDAIYKTDIKLAGNEPEVWAAQQAEQQVLRARMRFTAGQPPEPGIDWAKPFGPGNQQLETPLSPAAAAIAAIPLVPADPSGAPPPDPRAPYAVQYATVSGWAERFLKVPKFAGGAEAAAPLRPAHSWSYSPPRTEPELEVGSAAQPRIGAAPSAAQDNVLDAPAAPSHADRQSSLPSPAQEEVPQMELDEGEFAVTLPSGKEKKGSLAKLVELVASGEAPAGWPAFRAADRLWVPLQEGLTLESLVVRHDTSLGRETRKDSAWDGMAVQAAGSPFMKDWLKVEATGAEKQKKQRVLRSSGDQLKGGPFADEMPAMAEAVACSVDLAYGELLEREKLTKVDVIGAVVAAAPPPHILAAVQGAIMADRGLIRQVAASVLQSALRRVLEQPKGVGSHR